MIPTRLRCTAFAGHHRIASGELLHVAIKAKQAHDANPARPVLVWRPQCWPIPVRPLALDLLRVWMPLPQGRRRLQ